MVVKGVNIPNEWIDKQCEILDISIDEAVNMYLADVGAVDNEEQNALDEKAKKVKVKHGAESIKERKKVERKREPNELKREIISLIASTLEDCYEEEPLIVENLKISNVEKYIDFSVGDRTFTINLVEHRKPKK